MGLFGLFESPRDRELRQTRESWERVAAGWATRPHLRDGAMLLAVALLAHLGKIARLPNERVFAPLFDATVEILEGEELGDVEPCWPLIEQDVSAAVEFRRLVGRRGRWLAEYDARLAYVQRYLLGLWKVFIEVLPEGCFGSAAEDHALFDVPLIDVLSTPAEMIERCVVFAFADDYVRSEMFERLRAQLRRNLLRASNISLEANFADVRSRIVMPTQARGKTPAQLVDLYLLHTPFTQLFEAPVPFGVPEETRFEHGHILGGTGAGKTQLLQRMIHADLVAAGEDGRSVVVIDSQGDLISKLVRLDLFDPRHDHSLADRLVLIDPSDIEHPPSLNLFDAHVERLKEYRLADRERVLNGVVELYETMFGDMLGAELTQKQGVVFRYLARLMVTIPGATIYTLMELMEDGKAFKPHMEELDGSARRFFQSEFFHPSFAATKKQILRRLWGVLSTPAFERMFAQQDNKLDLFEATREGKIILISTAKELLKKDGSALLGRFFINLLAQAALERSVLSPDERTPAFVYVDEAQEYFDDGVETILQQARKYRIGLVAAHQSLDQASPGLRSALLANTSFKCVSGVSAKDARVLADELRTTSEFIEGMRRRGDTTEFAAWVKHETPRAVRLTIPLGYLERQPTLTEEAYDELIAENRRRYCGTLDALANAGRREPPTLEDEDEDDDPPPEPVVRAERPIAPKESVPAWGLEPRKAAAERPPPRMELGKGGKKHRYLQSLVAKLAQDAGFRATIEAAIKGGQVDILLERTGLSVAVEVSVTTPVEWERENLRKCLQSNADRIALVLAKSQTTGARYRAAVVEGLTDEDRARLTILHPEDLPDFIASLAPKEAPTEPVVRGYRVKVNEHPVSPEEAKARRKMIAKLVAQSMGRQ